MTAASATSTGRHEDEPREQPIGGDGPLSSSAAFGPSERLFNIAPSHAGLYTLIWDFAGMPPERYVATIMCVLAKVHQAVRFQGFVGDAQEFTGLVLFDRLPSDAAASALTARQKHVQCVTEEAGLCALEVNDVASELGDEICRIATSVDGPMVVLTGRDTVADAVRAAVIKLGRRVTVVVPVAGASDTARLQNAATGHMGLDELLPPLEADMDACDDIEYDSAESRPSETHGSLFRSATDGMEATILGAGVSAAAVVAAATRYSRSVLTAVTAELAAMDPIGRMTVWAELASAHARSGAVAVQAAAQSDTARDAVATARQVGQYVAARGGELAVATWIWLSAWLAHASQLRITATASAPSPPPATLFTPPMLPSLRRTLPALGD